MPSPLNIKKFNLTYEDAPAVFGLPQHLFYNEIAEAIPAEAWKQTDTQKNQIASTISVLTTDADRVSYLDIEGRKVSALKQKRLNITPSGELALASGVYPSFSQGSDSGRVITDHLYSGQSQRPRSMGFIYINNEGQPAGFALLAEPEGEHKGWILATIQNTTARLEERTVTVLATSNYVTSEAPSTVSMDNLDTIEEELKAAICHDEIAGLIKEIFNADGSLNATHLAELNKRLRSDKNLDGRDRKQAQLDILFSLASQDTHQNTALNIYIASMKQAIAGDINFFKTGVFELHLHELLHKLTSSEDKRLSLKHASELYADLYILAEENIFDTKKCFIYKQLKDHIQSEIQSITFNNTPEDTARLTKLSHLESSQIKLQVNDFQKKSSLIKRHEKNRKNLNNQKQTALDELNKSTQTSFSDRNFKAIGYSILIGSLIGLGLAVTLITSILPPLSIALIAIGTALVVSGGLSAAGVYTNEQTHTQQTNNFEEAYDAIVVSYDTKLIEAEQRFQHSIDASIFLTPSTHELSVSQQSLAENRCILWDNVDNESDYDDGPMESKTPDTPPRPSQK